MNMIFKNLFSRNPPKSPDKMGTQTEQAANKPLVVVGLGNPGARYATTRHNAGFMAVDFLHQQFGWEGFREEKKFSGLMSIGSIQRKKVFLVKPLTFMNESGRCVRAILDFYKLTPQALLVIHDEIDLPLGTVKTTSSSGSAGHNGVQDIIDALGTQDFSRIRLGIDRPRNTVSDNVGGPTETESANTPIHDYVLAPFTDSELEKITGLFPSIKDLVHRYTGE